MVTPETLAAAWRVAQHGAHIAMMAARANAPAVPIDPASLAGDNGQVRPSNLPVRRQALPTG